MLATACAKAQGWEQWREGAPSAGQDGEVPGQAGSKCPCQLQHSLTSLCLGVLIYATETLGYMSQSRVVQLMTSCLQDDQLCTPYVLTSQGSDGALQVTGRAGTGAGQTRSPGSQMQEGLALRGVQVQAWHLRARPFCIWCPVRLPCLP